MPGTGDLERSTLLTAVSVSPERDRVETEAQRLRQALVAAEAPNVARLVRIYVTVFGRPLIELMPLHQSDVVELVAALERHPGR